MKHLLLIEAAKELVNSSDYFVNFKLLKFTLSSLDSRRDLLPTQGIGT